MLTPQQHWQWRCGNCALTGSSPGRRYNIASRRDWTERPPPDYAANGLLLSAVNPCRRRHLPRPSHPEGRPCSEGLKMGSRAAGVSHSLPQRHSCTVHALHDEWQQRAGGRCATTCTLSYPGPTISCAPVQVPHVALPKRAYSAQQHLSPRAEAVRWGASLVLAACTELCSTADRRGR